MDLLGLKENGISISNLYKILIYFKDINLTEELCIPVFTLYCYYSVHFSFIYLGGEVYSNVAPSLPYLHALKTKNERNFSLRMDISKTVPGFKPINIIRTCTRAVYIRSTVYGVWK